LSGSIVLVNGHILTCDPRRPVVRAVAIRGGRVTVAGDDGDALVEKVPGSPVVDLRGCTAVPGFNDAHCHPMGLGFAAGEVDSRPESVADIGELVEAVRQRAAATPPGDWLLAHGYDDVRLADRRHPTRDDLDSATTDHPVLLERACHHVAVANTHALRLANITAKTPDPEGGAIDRDHHGEPTGVLREAAVDLVRAAVPEPTVEQIEGALRRAAGLYHAAGVTSVADAGIRRPEEMEAYQRLRERDCPDLRAYLMTIVDALLEPLSQAGLRTGFGDERLKIGPAKLFLDGSVGGRTARMRAPYEGEPDNYGLWMQDPDEMKQKIKRAHELGWQCTAHAIGDAAIDLLLDAYEEAQAESPRPDARHRVEHCEFVTTPSVFDRIRRLGCVPVPGTTFLRDFRPLYVQNLGEERLRYANAMKSLAEKGIVAAASSDAPVVTREPLVGIQTMMSRRGFDGEAAFPEESVSFEEAVRAYTWAGAYASFEEQIKGSLTPGMLGDVAVLGADARRIPAEEISGIGVDITVLGGEVVYGEP
jgi:predicted amidohydrolase YtcJ